MNKLATILMVLIIVLSNITIVSAFATTTESWNDQNQISKIIKDSFVKIASIYGSETQWTVTNYGNPITNSYNPSLCSFSFYAQPGGVSSRTASNIPCNADAPTVMQYIATEYQVDVLFQGIEYCYGVCTGTITPTPTYTITPTPTVTSTPTLDCPIGYIYDPSANVCKKSGNNTLISVIIIVGLVITVGYFLTKKR